MTFYAQQYKFVSADPPKASGCLLDSAEPFPWTTNQAFLGCDSVALAVQNFPYEERTFAEPSSSHMWVCLPVSSTDSVQHLQSRTGQISGPASDRKSTCCGSRSAVDISGFAKSDVELSNDEKVLPPRVVLSSSALRRRRRLRASAFAKVLSASERNQRRNLERISFDKAFRSPASIIPPEKVEKAERITNCDETNWGDDADMKGRARDAALDATGCRVLQNILREGDKQIISGLVAELHGSVRRLIASPHGNYVIQTVIEVMPTALAAFVSEELKGAGAQTARHKYGCRIICRLLEHSAYDSQTIEFVEEILREARDLCNHTFGHHVMECILEHGLPAHKKKVTQALLDMLPKSALNKSGTHVIAAALKHGSSTDQADLALSLINVPGGFLRLAEDKNGMHVVRAVLRMTGEHARIARNMVSQNIAQLEGSLYGTRILSELN